MQLPSILNPLLAIVGLRQVDYGAEETVTVSSVRLHKLGSPVDVKIPSLSFKLSGNDADGLECSAADVSWPEPGFNRCGNSKYSFALLSGTSIGNGDHEFNLMIYHDVGDRYVTHPSPGNQVFNIWLQKGGFARRYRIGFRLSQPRRRTS